MKICTICNIEKPESEFYKKLRYEEKLRSFCKDCHNPNKFKTCGYCGIDWKATGGGHGKRAQSRCDVCYNYYRRSVNLFHAALDRARQRNLEFTLLREWIEEKIRDGCERTGIAFDVSPRSGGDNYSNRSSFCPSLDKIDPFKGYTPDNVQVVCWIYNVAKQQSTDEEVLKFCESVIAFNGKKNL